MIVTKQTPISQVRQRGNQALLEKLGPVDYLRFLRDLGVGAGDYVHERRRWLDKITMDGLDRMVREHRRGKRPRRSQ
jgi:hypothetical protein